MNESKTILAVKKYFVLWPWYIVVNRALSIIKREGKEGKVMRLGKRRKSASRKRGYVMMPDEFHGHGCLIWMDQAPQSTQLSVSNNFVVVALYICMIFIT